MLPVLHTAPLWSVAVLRRLLYHASDRLSTAHCVAGLARGVPHAAYSDSEMLAGTASRAVPHTAKEHRRECYQTASYGSLAPLVAPYATCQQLVQLLPAQADTAKSIAFQRKRYRVPVQFAPECNSFRRGLRVFLPADSSMGRKAAAIAGWTSWSEKCCVRLRT
eukprot:1063699-Rhodomonas_salina.1